MAETIIEIMGRWGYFGVLALIAVENIFPPIPSEVILTFAGFLTTVTSLTYGGVVAAATAGSVAGAVVLYLAGSAVSPERMRGFLSTKTAQRLRLDAEAYQTACNKFAKYGTAGVLFFRCVPIMRSIISVPAGMSHMPWGLFLALTTLGSTLWNLLLVGLGAVAGTYWYSVSAFFAQLTRYTRATLIAALLVLAIVLYVRHCYRKKKQDKAAALAAEIKANSIKS